MLAATIFYQTFRICCISATTHCKQDSYLLFQQCDSALLFFHNCVKQRYLLHIRPVHCLLNIRTHLQKRQCVTLYAGI